MKSLFEIAVVKKSKNLLPNVFCFRISFEQQISSKLEKEVDMKLAAFTSQKPMFSFLCFVVVVVVVVLFDLFAWSFSVIPFSQIEEEYINYVHTLTTLFVLFCCCYPMLFSIALSSRVIFKTSYCQLFVRSVHTLAPNFHALFT